MGEDVDHGHAGEEAADVGPAGDIVLAAGEQGGPDVLQRDVEDEIDPGLGVYCQLSISNHI